MATKDLDFGNVIKMVYDPPTESLKVLATITIGSITVDLDASNDSVRLGDGVLLNTLTNVGGKNAIDVNIAGGTLVFTIDQADDSIRLGDGTVLFTGTTVGLKTGLDINLINTSLPLAAGSATEAKQDNQITELTGINTKLNTSNSLLTSLDTKLTTPLAVTGTVTVAEPLIISGTEDGTVGGTERAFVNNQRLQVLAAKDRQESYTYTDFGTRNQRVTRVDYTSATFPGIVVRRDFNYVLDNNKYKPTITVWSII